MIPYGCQNIDQDDIKAVADVLKSEYLTQGPCVPEFEDQLCQLTGSKFSIAVLANNGTPGLEPIYPPQ